MRSLFLSLTLIAVSSASPIKLLVIGDSQSEEYAFEVPFSAPDSSPLVANTQNWIEILAEHRAEELDFGSYENQLFSYPDLRNGGYALNWGVPTAETETWAQVASSSIFQDQEFLSSKFQLTQQLPEVDAIIIILGGNDASSEYRGLYQNTPPSNWPAQIVANLKTLIDFIQEWTNSPIHLANIPDVGETTRFITRFPDAEKRAIATGHIRQANEAIAELSQDEGTSLINFFSLTETLSSDGPIRIGNVEFFPFPNSENAPRHLLCKDGFHPSTSIQCLLANLILEKLELTPLTEDEILGDILNIPPDADDDYLSWINALTTETSFLTDPDGDGLPNLGEYALGKMPHQADAPLFQYEPLSERSSKVQTRPMSSNDLINWQESDGVTEAPSGVFTINSTLPFSRLEFTLTP